MFLQSIASAFPPYYFTQKECWSGMREAPPIKALRPGSRTFLEKILLGNSGIAKRHFCLPNPTEVFYRDAESLNRVFEQEAPQLSGEALRRAIKQTGTPVSSIDAVFLCTCTGYLCPGVTSHLAEQFGMRSDTYLQDLVGLGCGAAIPTMRSAANFLSANPDATVAVIAVEICSAAFYADDDPGVLVSLCLFGDGASASIWKSTPPETGPAYQVSDFRTLHKPGEREKIRFVNASGKLRNQLHRSVPAIAADAVAELYQSCGLNGNVDRILAHTGGRDVLDSLECTLPNHPMPESREVLQNYGNVSSPSVMVALDRHLQSAQPMANLWLTSFGAGFAVHSAQLTRS